MSASHPTVAAVLVTHDAAPWLEATLSSIVAQRHQPDAIVIVDDQSTDDTRAIIERTLGARARVLRATSHHPDTTTRIAQNFQQGLRAVRDHDVAVLGDHDDLWHPARIGHQVNQLRLHPEVEMLASDGRLVDASGRATGGTLRTAFPVPEDFNTMQPAEQMRAALRRSIATGGASAVRPAAFADVVIPEGWLHDRWWSLVATARGAMRLDAEAVIDYRVAAGQEVGLDPGRQGLGTPQRLQEAVTHAPATLRRAADLRALRAFSTDPDVRRVLSPLGLIGALR